MTWASFRNGTKVHTKRPKASEKSARWAWDRLSTRGDIIDMKLIYGYWMCQRPSGDLDEVEAIVAREQSCKS